MFPSTNWGLIVIGVILILIEVLMGAITGFDFLLIGSAILAGGVLGLLVRNTWIGIAVAGVLSLAYILIGRRRIRARLRRRGLLSSVDAMVGRTVRVSETITADRAGRIRFEGEEWRAVLEGSGAATIEAGGSARVVRIEGVTVFVQPLEVETGA